MNRSERKVQDGDRLVENYRRWWHTEGKRLLSTFPPYNELAVKFAWRAGFLVGVVVGGCHQRQLIERTRQARARIKEAAPEKVDIS